MKIHNTLTRKKEDFIPLVPGEIRMYVCGVTVYDLSHIGHARSAIAFDVMRRYLAAAGYRVTFVKNFTDVDDRIIRRAQAEGVPASAISERYVEAYRADMEALGVLAPDVEPKATEHIPQMIRLIERLVALGVAYAIDGDVYFEVARFTGYGKLSGKNLDELLAGARVEVDERKRDPRDFALWKSAKPGEPSWDGPWGPGRPGWHIECSAMAMQYLGESFDLHGGGEDLIFPHHDCEIAQSEAVTGQPLARYWIHNAFVNMGTEKMSKSLGNTVTIRDLMQRHDPEAIRLYLIGTHYRAPLEWTADGVGDSARALERLRDLVHGEQQRAVEGAGDAGGLPGEVARCRERFTSALEDDFNTPQALAALFDLAGALYVYRDQMLRGKGISGPFIAGIRELREMAGTLGLLQRTPPQGWGFIPRSADSMSPGQPLPHHVYGDQPAPASAEWWTGIQQRIEDLVEQRDRARQARDFGRADQIRAELAAMGARIEDTPAGTRWKWKSV